MSEKPHPATQRAIDAAGGVSALARLVGVTAPAIVFWRQRGIPPARVIEVEALTGVSRHELRPDVFGEQAS